MCLVLWCTHTKKVGVPYIYRGIAYDSRRGRGNTRVQWGGHLPAHERTTHIRRQAVQASNACTFSERQAQTIILSLLPSVLMIVGYPIH